jgi:hypothetical protein
MEWLLTEDGSLDHCGCSARVVPSGVVAARLFWFTQKFWLLFPFGSVAGYSMIVVLSARVVALLSLVLSALMAAHHNWFGQPGWLLAIDGSLPDLGCSVFVFLSLTLAALQIWFSHVEGLLYIYGSVVYIGSGTRTRFQVWPSWLSERPSVG